MSNYVVTTNFTSKDGLPSGNAAKIVKGAELGTEFANIATMSATKYDPTVIAAAPVGFNDGTSSLPGITFASDPSNGIYRIGANSWGFASAGLSRLTVDANGQWNLVAPTSGVGLTINGVSGTQPLTLKPASTTDVGAIINGPTSGRSALIYQVNSVQKLIFGVNNAANDIISGTALNDTVLSTPNGLAINSTSVKAVGPVAGTLQDMTPDSGTFTMTYTSMTTTVTGTASWVRYGKIVTLNFPTATGTSNGVNFTATGLPAAIQPATLTQFLPGPSNCFRDNGATINTSLVQVEISAGSGTITFLNTGNAAGWTAASTKGIVGTFSVTYSLS